MSGFSWLKASVINWSALVPLVLQSKSAPDVFFLEGNSKYQVEKIKFKFQSAINFFSKFFVLTCKLQFEYAIFFRLIIVIMYVICKDGALNEHFLK